MRPAIWLVLAGSGLAAYAQPREIAATASSPYDLAKYVQEHHNTSAIALQQGSRRFEVPDGNASLNRRPRGTDDRFSSSVGSGLRGLKRLAHRGGLVLDDEHIGADRRFRFAPPLFPFLNGENRERKPGRRENRDGRDVSIHCSAQETWKRLVRPCPALSLPCCPCPALAVPALHCPAVPW